MAYSTRADVELIYGVKNVEQWADLDGDSELDTIENRVTNAIKVADEYIDSHLKSGPYEIPFTGTIPFLIKDASARLAGYFLAQSRNVSEGENVVTTTELYKRYVDGVLRQILQGQIQLSGVTREIEEDYPKVVRDSDDS